MKQQRNLAILLFVLTLVYCFDHLTSQKIETKYEDPMTFDKKSHERKHPSSFIESKQWDIDTISLHPGFNFLKTDGVFPQSKDKKKMQELTDDKLFQAGYEPSPKDEKRQQDTETDRLHNAMLREIIKDILQRMRYNLSKSLSKQSIIDPKDFIGEVMQKCKEVLNKEKENCPPYMTPEEIKIKLLQKLNAEMPHLMRDLFEKIKGRKEEEEKPKEKPEEKPAEKSEEKPKEKSEEKPKEKSEEKPKEKSKEKPKEKSKEKPTEKKEKPTEKKEKPTEKKEKPTEKKEKPTEKKEKPTETEDTEEPSGSDPLINSMLKKHTDNLFSGLAKLGINTPENIKKLLGKKLGKILNKEKAEFPPSMPMKKINQKLNQKASDLRNRLIKGVIVAMLKQARKKIDPSIDKLISPIISKMKSSEIPQGITKFGVKDPESLRNPVEKKLKEVLADLKRKFPSKMTEKELEEKAKKILPIVIRNAIMKNAIKSTIAETKDLVSQAISNAGTGVNKPKYFAKIVKKKLKKLLNKEKKKIPSGLSEDEIKKNFVQKVKEELPQIVRKAVVGGMIKEISTAMSDDISLALPRHGVRDPEALRRDIQNEIEKRCTLESQIAPTGQSLQDLKKNLEKKAKDMLPQAIRRVIVGNIIKSVIRQSKPMIYQALLKNNVTNIKINIPPFMKMVQQSLEKNLNRKSKKFHPNMTYIEIKKKVMEKSQMDIPKIIPKIISDPVNKIILQAVHQMKKNISNRLSHLGKKIPHFIKKGINKKIIEVLFNKKKLQYPSTMPEKKIKQLFIRIARRRLNKIMGKVIASLFNFKESKKIPVQIQPVKKIRDISSEIISALRGIIIQTLKNYGIKDPETLIKEVEKKLANVIDREKKKLPANIPEEETKQKLEESAKKELPTLIRKLLIDKIIAALVSKMKDNIDKELAKVGISDSDVVRYVAQKNLSAILNKERKKFPETMTLDEIKTKLEAKANEELIDILHRILANPIKVLIHQVVSEMKKEINIALRKHGIRDPRPLRRVVQKKLKKYLTRVGKKYPITTPFKELRNKLRNNAMYELPKIIRRLFHDPITEIIFKIIKKMQGEIKRALAKEGIKKKHLLKKAIKMVNKEIFKLLQKERKIHPSTMGENEFKKKLRHKAKSDLPKIIMKVIGLIKEQRPQIEKNKDRDHDFLLNKLIHQTILKLRGNIIKALSLAEIKNLEPAKEEIEKKIEKQLHQEKKHYTPKMPPAIIRGKLLRKGKDILDEIIIDMIQNKQIGFFKPGKVVKVVIYQMKKRIIRGLKDHGVKNPKKFIKDVTRLLKDFLTKELTKFQPTEIFKIVKKQLIFKANAELPQIIKNAIKQGSSPPTPGKKPTLAGLFKAKKKEPTKQQKLRAELFSPSKPQGRIGNRLINVIKEDKKKPQAKKVKHKKPKKKIPKKRENAIPKPLKKVLEEEKEIAKNARNELQSEVSKELIDLFKNELQSDVPNKLTSEAEPPTNKLVSDPGNKLVSTAEDISNKLVSDPGNKLVSKAEDISNKLVSDPGNKLVSTAEDISNKLVSDPGNKLVSTAEDISNKLVSDPGNKLVSTAEDISNKLVSDPGNKLVSTAEDMSNKLVSDPGNKLVSTAEDISNKLVSDPGNKLVSTAEEISHKLVSVPGDTLVSQSPEVIPNELVSKISDAVPNELVSKISDALRNKLTSSMTTPNQKKTDLVSEEIKSDLRSHLHSKRRSLRSEKDR